MLRTCRFGSIILLLRSSSDRPSQEECSDCAVWGLVRAFRPVSSCCSALADVGSCMALPHHIGIVIILPQLVTSSSLRAVLTSQAFYCGLLCQATQSFLSGPGFEVWTMSEAFAPSASFVPSILKTSVRASLVRAPEAGNVSPQHGSLDRLRAGTYCDGNG